MTSLSSLAAAADPVRAALDRDHRALDALQHGVLVLDAEGGLLRANPAAHRILGASARALAARPFHRWLLTAVDGTALDEADHPVSRVLSRRAATTAEVCVKGGDGVVRHVMVSAKPLEGAAGGEVLVELTEVPTTPKTGNGSASG